MYIGFKKELRQFIIDSELLITTYSFVDLVKSVSEVPFALVLSSFKSMMLASPLSQDILSNLRTFVEAVSVKASGQQEYSFKIFQPFRLLGLQVCLVPQVHQQ